MKNLKSTCLILLSILINPILFSQTVTSLYTDQGFYSDEALMVDYDNDGDLDIVLATKEGSRRIYVLINDDTKTFPITTIQSVGINSDIFDIQAKDMDNDGDVDFVVCTGGNSGELYWLQNNGNDVFIKWLLDFDEYFTSAVIEDFNNDGNLDIAACYYESTNMYLNDGYFNFPKTAITTDDNNDYHIKTADFNNDGDIDLLIGGTISGILLNDGTGNFPIFDTLNIGGESLHIITNDPQIVDLNNNGSLDILAHNSHSFGGFYYLPGPGFPTAEEAFPTEDFVGGDCGGDIAVFDVDGNGLKDIVRQEQCANNHIDNRHLYLLSQTSPMVFDTIILDVDYQSRPTRMAYGDLDNDGDIDLFTTTRNNNENISWWENINGKLYKHTVYGQIREGKSAKFGDVDGDGDMEVLIAAGDYSIENTNEIILFENKGNDVYKSWHILDDFGGAYEAEFADIDADGDLDIFASSKLDNQLIWLENTGVIYDWIKHDIDLLAAQSKGITITDINLDGLPDVVNVHIDKIFWYRNNSNGSSFTRITIDPIIQNLNKVKTGDFNNDGDIDLVAISDDGISSVLYYDNPGTNTSFTKSVILTGAEAKNLDVADLDADGNLDIVVCFMDYYNSTTFMYEDVIAFYGNGSGAFTSDVLESVQGETQAVATADFDSDGDVDVVFGTNFFDGSLSPIQNGGLIYWLENLGSGVFTDKQFIATTYPDGEITDICIADSNNDTSMDIAVIDEQATIPYVITLPGVTCIADLNFTGAISPAIYKAGNSIESSNATITGNTTFDAKNYIILDFGFEVPFGNEFYVIIGGCE